MPLATQKIDVLAPQVLPKPSQDLEQARDAALFILRTTEWLGPNPEAYGGEEAEKEIAKRLSDMEQDTTIVTRRADTGAVVSTVGLRDFDHGRAPIVTRGMIVNVATDPDFRKRGIARDALNRIHEIAEDRGMTETSVTTTGMGASLYSKNGYNPGTHPNWWTKVLSSQTDVEQK